MDLYELLGVRKNASVADLRRAFQKRARSLHPDLNPGDPVAAERFREVARAFEILSDPQRRGAYDRGEPSVAPAAPLPEAGFEGFDFSAQVGVESVRFRDLFEAAHPGTPAREAARGEDLEQATRVSFEESLHGTSRRVHLGRFESCETCGGSGEVAYGPVPCPRCHGTGQVRGSRGHMIFSRPCTDCEGSGRLHRRDCARCSGEGRRMGSEWLDVQIPPGVGDGSHVRLPGGGNAGRRGGPPGDFVLVVQVEPHERFRREGEDLFCAVEVGMAEAALGAHIEVETPEGPVTIEVPAGTQNAQRFRLRKRGMPRLGEKGRGDLYVEARVVIPAVTEDRARELLRELERIQPQDVRRVGARK